MLAELIPRRERLFVTGDIPEMLLVVFFIFLIVARLRHSIEHPAGGGEVRAADVELRRIQHFRRLRRHRVKHSEESEDHQHGDAHDQNLPADLGTGVGHVAIQKHQIEKGYRDLIGIRQHAFLPPQPGTVDESSIETAEVVNPGLAIPGNADLRMKTGDDVVGNDDVVLRSGTDADERFLQPYKFPFAGTVQKFQPVHIAGAEIPDLGRLDQELAIADGHPVISFEHTAGEFPPVIMNGLLSAALKPHLAGTETKFRLIIGGNPVLLRNDPVIVRSTADPDGRAQRIRLRRMDQLTPAAELQKTHISAFLPLDRRSRLRGAILFSGFQKQLYHSSIVQTFFMIFTCRRSSGEGKRRRHSLMIRFIPSRSSAVW